METTYELICPAGRRQSALWLGVRTAVTTAVRTVAAVVKAEPHGAVWRNADPAATFATLARAEQSRLLDRGIAPRI
jgi:hypothetical protein